MEPFYKKPKVNKPFFERYEEGKMKKIIPSKYQKESVTNEMKTPDVELPKPSRRTFEPMSQGSEEMVGEQVSKLVKQGDSLSSDTIAKLARRFEVSPQEIEKVISGFLGDEEQPVTQPQPQPLEENDFDAEQEEMDAMEEETNPLYTMLMGDDDSAPVSIKNIYATTENSVEGILPNELQFLVTDNGDNLQLRMFLPDGNEEVEDFSYDDVDSMFDLMNQRGLEQPSQQPLEQPSQPKWTKLPNSHTPNAEEKATAHVDALLDDVSGLSAYLRGEDDASQFASEEDMANTNEGLLDSIDILTRIYGVSQEEIEKAQNTPWDPEKSGAIMDRYDQVKNLKK